MRREILRLEGAQSKQVFQASISRRPFSKRCTFLFFSLLWGVDSKDTLFCKKEVFCIPILLQSVNLRK
jgi:hypothetical protein